MWQFGLGFILGMVVMAAVAIPEVRDWLKGLVVRK